jgi:hypothetical protein
MDFAMTGVDHEPFVVRVDNELLQQGLPKPPITPAAKASMGVLPVSIGSRQVSPWRARAKNPEHGVDETAIILGNPTPNAGAPGQVGLKQRPVSVGDIVSMEDFWHGVLKFVVNTPLSHIS